MSKDHQTNLGAWVELVPNRRALGVGLLAAVVGGLVTRTVAAFPRGFRQDFARASELLARFGLRVSGSEGDHDTVTVTARSRRDTEYDFVVNEREPGVGRVPALRTSFFNDVSEFEHFDVVDGSFVPCVKTLVDGSFVTFEHFDVNQSTLIPCIKTTVEGEVRTFEHFDPVEGGIEPCLRTTIAPGVDTFEHFDPGEGGVEPCFRTTIAGEVTTFEHFDVDDGSVEPCLRTTIAGRVRTFEHFDPKDREIDPCWRATVVEGEAGATTEIAINDANIDFAVTVGGRSWRLRDGELVETRT